MPTGLLVHTDRYEASLPHRYSHPQELLTALLSGNQFHDSLSQQNPSPYMQLFPLIYEIK